MDPRCYFINVINDITTLTVLGMNDYLVWILIAIMLLISALYSASENAYSNCNKYHFISKKDKGSLNAKIVLYLIDKFDSTLVNVLIGNNIVQTLMSFLSAMLFYNLSIYYNWAEGIEAIVSTLVMSFLVYIISDTCPKILSKAMPNRMASILAFPVFITTIILYPISWIFKLILFLVHKIFRIKDNNIFTKEDLISNAKIAINDEEIDETSEEDEKLFEKDEEKILSNALKFSEKKVKDIYKENKEVTSINIKGLNATKLNKKLINIPYTRIPIYENKKDNIIGILVLKTYFEEYVKDSHLEIRSILEDVVSININMNIDDAFKELNKEKVHLGIVYDDNSLMKGIISMEDILEELVSDIDEKNQLEILNKESQNG